MYLGISSLVALQHYILPATTYHTFHHVTEKSSTFYCVVYDT